MGKAHLRRHASLWLARLRESSQIAFSLRRRALLRLIAYAGIARRLEKSTSYKLVRRLKSLRLLDKCYRKNPRAGFSFWVNHIF